MRSVVVLPAPLGPSRPVISPSRASKPTSSTATTGRLLSLPGKVLRRCSATIMCVVLSERARSGFPAVEGSKRRRIRHRLQAFGVERLGVGAIDELREQLRHAAGADDVVALAADDQVA